MSYIIELPYTRGATVYAFPSGAEPQPEDLADWLTKRVLATETDGLYRATVDAATYGPTWYFFEGATVPSGFDEYIGSVDLQYIQAIETLLARTTAGFITSAPVAVDGSIDEIIIGDDYLAANGRAFSWTVDAIEGFVVGECVCKFGGRLDDDNTWLVTGSIVDNEDDTWTLSADLENTDTATLKEGGYLWSVQVEHDGVEITRVKADCKTKLVRKQT